jgi:hypothetical protein
MNLKVLSIFVVAIIALSMAIVFGCAIEDTAEESADTSFSNEVEFNLDPLTFDDSEDIQTRDGQCGQTSVKQQLEANDIDPSEAKISSITIQYIETRYKNATWAPEELSEVTCTLWVWGDTKERVDITKTAVKGAGSDWTEIDVSADATTLLNYYLKNRGEEFDYCVECTGGDSHHVEYFVSIGVIVQGEDKG